MPELLSRFLSGAKLPKTKQEKESLGMDVSLERIFNSFFLTCFVTILHFCYTKVDTKDAQMSM